MQVNSAQDYLTAQKRRIVAAQFVQEPAPAHRRYNYVITSVQANKASRYEKTPYPQNLSLAPQSTPGPVLTAGQRPTVNGCCLASGSLV